MKYIIKDNWGVPVSGAPFILHGNKEFTMEFVDISGDYMARISNSSGLSHVSRVERGKATFKKRILASGVWSVELIKIENGVIIDKILCAPITINSINNAESGYICYPESGYIFNEIDKIKNQLKILTEWKDKVEPLIHEHKITL